MDANIVSDFTETRLREALGERQFRFYPQTGSSNDDAIAWLMNADCAEMPADGSLVIADEQTKGRGRLGRTWFAPPATALMFSYMLRPLPQELPYTSMAASVAVCEAVASWDASLPVGIKWPNDVQISGRKLCGILPEAAWQGDKLVGVALGIGINIRIDFTASPFATTAVSLESVSHPLDRAEFLTLLLERLDDWTRRLSSDALFEAWRSRLVTLGQQVSITNASGTISGTAASVERSGALMIRDHEKRLQRVIAGDIALG